MVSDKQVMKLFSSFSETGSVTMSAMTSGMHRNTAGKYLDRKKLPSELKKPHGWRTRKDPFAEVWPEVEVKLQAMPELDAVELFEVMRREHPGKFADGQLRSLQRRVRAYRVSHGDAQEVFFPQEKRPGQEVAIDWTKGTILGVTINGEVFSHLLFHAVLVYSGWEWATIVRSESFLSLKTGLQEALYRIGGAPRVVLSDNSSAATHQIGNGKEDRVLNVDYGQLLDHLNMKSRTINIACPNENGSVEVMHGHLRRRLRQALLLRGSHDFASEAEYEKFLHEQLERANRNRQKKVAEELPQLQALPTAPLPSYTDLPVTVGSGATIRAARHTYSVPSQLIGAKVVVRLTETTLAVLTGRTVVYQTQRVERGGIGIDYRHVIGSLVKKPGAFRNYRHRDEMFPSPVFREVFARLCATLTPGESDREYLRILKLAADLGEDQVTTVLARHLETNAQLTHHGVREAIGAQKAPPPIQILHPDLAVYDLLLTAGAQ